MSKHINGEGTDLNLQPFLTYSALLKTSQPGSPSHHTSSVFPLSLAEDDI